MSETLSPYQITEQLHDTFFSGNGPLTHDELKASGVYTAVGSMSSNTSRRIEAMGQVDGRLARQVLAKDRFGNFSFSTYFLEKGGELVQSNIRPESPPEKLDPISASLFMQTVIKTILDRA
ncbi:MAG TPA: hypothetical protein VLE73_02730 [Candidatus Saccharimonadales bacterium]|nr:hypothetical protein [Candidatus Saccharimonadales bacterium]